MYGERIFVKSTLEHEHENVSETQLGGYCVIAETGSNSVSYGRRVWFAKEDDAIRHASKLLRNNHSNNPGTKIYVVQAVDVLILEDHPVTVISLPDN